MKISVYKIGQFTDTKKYWLAYLSDFNAKSGAVSWTHIGEYKTLSEARAYKKELEEDFKRRWKGIL